jgi:hypothetical protein
MTLLMVGGALVLGMTWLATVYVHDHRPGRLSTRRVLTEACLIGPAIGLALAAFVRLTGLA